MHLTGRDVFDPGGDAHESLIQPVNFAKRALVERNSRQLPDMPHVDHHWEQNRRCLDQATRWRAAGAIVELRDLKYTYQRGADGKAILDVNGKKVPSGRPKEKSIDVLCALACVREAVDPDIDLVVLASRDTDLVPVLDELYDFRGDDPARYARIETVAWFDPQARREGRYAGGNLRPSAPRRVWNTNLDRFCHDASIDRHADR